MMKVVRELWAASLPQARLLAGKLGHEGLTGTLSEMELLKSRLHRQGVPADIIR
ncbi:hypothetical protein [Streptomyces sp. SP18CS02]|uniref:hypothetical protein n=1 Tax=Streptomyces sp. SP18CS02 TaxID=3002531 RepID=UPI002E75A6F5|nr:hypothetical protein [Streptomyces sp. SP18CS02]MEE1750991.1 hypothetical protein [Streptomyces sp. SP18CS02]